jgi:hypothetical protein
MDRPMAVYLFNIVCELFLVTCDLCNPYPHRCNPFNEDYAHLYIKKPTQQNMTLAQQFPDISAVIRSKKEATFKNSGSVNARQSLRYTEAEAVTRYYEGEFKRWHVKFLFIVAAALGAVYLIMFMFFWVYNLISIR